MRKQKQKTSHYFWRAPLQTALWVFAVVAVLSLARAGPARAAPGTNQQLNYQARLLTSQGAVVPDGLYNIEFKIYQDGDGVLGGGDESLKWTESRTGANRVTVKNGYFSVYLGSTNPFGSSVDWDQDTLWLSVNIGGTAVTPAFDGEMSPFTRLSSTPYAINSRQLGGLTSDKFVQLAQNQQIDSSVNASISINDTGGGSFLEFLSTGTPRFSVRNNGTIAAATALDTINGIIINNGAISGVAGFSQSSGNFDASASSGTFGTTTGEVSLNGDTTVTGIATLTVSGGLTSLGNGLDITSGGASITGGIDNNSGGITETGALSGVTTISASGLYTSSGSINLTGSAVYQNDGVSGVSLACGSDQFIDQATISGGIITSTSGCANDSGLSDSRLKKNVTSLSDGVLSSIRNVNVVNFNFDCSTDIFYQSGGTISCDETKLETGVVAQELQTIFPDLVVQGADGYYRVNYGGLSSYNLKAVQELAEFINSDGDADFTSISINGTQMFSSTGVLQSITGLTVISGGASITGGLTLPTGDIALTAGALSTNGAIRLTNAGALQNITGLTQTGGVLSLTASSGALALSGMGASSLDFGTNDLTITSANFNTTATGINGTAIGATATSSGAFTTLSASGATTLGSSVSGAGLTSCSGANNRLTYNGSTFGCDTMTTRSYADSTVDTAADNDTTDYWDMAAENGNTYPNLTPTSSSNEIFGIVTMEVSQTSGNGDVELVASIRYTTNGTDPTCSATTVGSNLSTFTTNNGASAASTINFVLAAGVTSEIRFTVCSNSATNGVGGGLGGSAANITRLRLTLFEVNNAADLAEVYPSNDLTLMPGEVVGLDPELDNGAARTHKTYQQNTYGVVTTKPAMVIGGTNGSGTGGVAVALSGRVPVRVSTENGAIKKGDVLTSSSTPGVAMKATKAGPMIGVAMTDYDGDAVGLVTMFVKSGNYTGTLDSLLSDSTLQADISSSQALLERIKQQGNAGHSSSIFADSIAASQELITPQITTDAISLSKLYATYIDFGLTLKEAGRFSITNSRGEDVVTFDEAGNITFKGALQSEQAVNNLVEEATNQVLAKTDERTRVLLQNGLTISGHSVFNASVEFNEVVSFAKDVMYAQDVIFQGRPVFNNDTGGFATIEKGDAEIRIEFTKPFDDIPVVNVNNIDGQFIPYTYKNLDKTGFTIVVPEPVEEDSQFSWTAFAISNALMYYSGQDNLDN